jgi:hypothetical protein
LGSRPVASLVLSEKQQAQRDRFSQASRFAKSILVVPEAHAEYKLLASKNEFLTPYSAAVSDSLTNPEVTQIDVSAYAGKVGDKIAIRTADEYKFIAVSISILKADGSVLESGNAASTIATRLEWDYAAQQNVAALAGMKIVVKVQDRPGHEITAEKVLA